MTRNGNSYNGRNAGRDSNNLQTFKPFNFEWVVLSWTWDCNSTMQTCNGLTASPEVVTSADVVTQKYHCAP